MPDQARSSEYQFLDRMTGPDAGEPSVDVTPTEDEIADAERARKRRRMLNRTAIVLAVLVLAGLAAFAPTGIRMWRQSDARVDTPDHVSGLNRDDSPGARDTADYLKTAMAARVSFDKTFGAVYRDPADSKRDVIIVGGTAFIFRPENELDGLLSALNDQAGNVTDIKTLDAGSLGGVVKCGTTTIDADTIAVCGWADHGSVAVALFTARPVTESAPLLLTLRTAMLHRN